MKASRLMTMVKLYVVERKKVAETPHYKSSLVVLPTDDAVLGQNPSNQAAKLGWVGGYFKLLFVFIFIMLYSNIDVRSDLGLAINKLNWMGPSTNSTRGGSQSFIVIVIIIIIIVIIVIIFIVIIITIIIIIIIFIGCTWVACAPESETRWGLPDAPEQSSPPPGKKQDYLESCFASLKSMRVDRSPRKSLPLPSCLF